jgi:predicted enzyme involved in methoxymalonyl-ACP biosynthesis
MDVHQKGYKQYATEIFMESISMLYHFQTERIILFLVKAYFQSKKWESCLDQYKKDCLSALPTNYE